MVLNYAGLIDSGGAGGSGGGCMPYESTGNWSGGTNGEKGSDTRTGMDDYAKCTGGSGQGHWKEKLRIIKHHKISGGAGGSFKEWKKGHFRGGSGGGGILIDGEGPFAEHTLTSANEVSGIGGHGYGAGGGAGGAKSQGVNATS